MLWGMTVILIVKQNKIFKQKKNKLESLKVAKSKDWYIVDGGKDGGGGGGGEGDGGDDGGEVVGKGEVKWLI